MTRVLAAPEKGSSDLKTPFLVSRDSFDSELEASVQVANCTSHNREKVEIVEGTAAFRHGSSGDVSSEELSSPPIPGPQGDPG